MRWPIIYIKKKETFLSLSKQEKQESNPHWLFWRQLNYHCSIPLYVIIKYWAQYKTRIYIFCIRSRCTSLCTNWAIFILLSSMPDSNQHLWYTKPTFSTFELMEHLYGWRDSNSYWTGFKPDAIFQLGYTRISLSSQTESNWHFIHTKDMYSTFILWEHLLLSVSPSGIEPLSKT